MTQKDELHRHRDGLWIQHKKRTYLYWYKFLQEAELSETHAVDWTHYEEWGGKSITDMKFDIWWETHWKDLFGIKKTGSSQTVPRFQISTRQPKTTAIRLSLLVWQNRNVGLNIDKHSVRPKKAGNALKIAEYIIAHEKRKATDLSNFDLNDKNLKFSEIQTHIGRYLRAADKILGNVCMGHFP